MKIHEVFQRQQINEESLADIAKAAYAGATGQKDLFGTSTATRGQTNPNTDKALKGANWLISNFNQQAKGVRTPSPEAYQKIVTDLMDQMAANQTGFFSNLKKKIGLGATPSSDIPSLVTSLKQSLGSAVKEVPQLGRALDSLDRTYKNILNQAAQYQPGQNVDPDLQRNMQGFATIWYNLPDLMKSAMDRSIASAGYGERWIDAGQGIEIKPATAYDRTIQARYQDDIFYFDPSNNRWLDGARKPVSPEMAYGLNQALETVGIKTQKSTKTGAVPSAAAAETDISKTVEPGMQYKFANPEDPTINIIIRNSGYYYDRLPPELRGGQVKRDKDTGLYPVTRPDNIKKINAWYDQLADRRRVIHEPISAL